MKELLRSNSKLQGLELLLVISLTDNCFLCKPVRKSETCRVSEFPSVAEEQVKLALRLSPPQWEGSITLVEPKMAT